LQKSHHSHWFSRTGHRKPPHTKRHRLHALVASHQPELEEKGTHEYKTRTEWHRIISWNKLAEWAGTLQKGAHIEVEGELRYREYTPTKSDRSVRVAEIHVTSIFALDRSDRQPVSTPESEPADEPVGLTD
jgi:single-strand DNA-binding protein